MSVIEIEWLHADHDCETCGGNYAEGARVSIDSIRTLDMTPFAHCFNDISFDREFVYRAIIRELGHSVIDAPSPEQDDPQP